MEFKRLITHFTYRIEPQPEGGFIAHASDPNMPPLEAPTHEELQQKIQAAINASLAVQFPGLKLPLQGQGAKFNFHIESKPGGAFAIHSADPNAPPMEGTQEEVESHFAEKLITVAEKLSPELRQALAAQGISGNVKVLVSSKTMTLKGGSQGLSLGLGQDLLPTGATAKAGDKLAGATATPGAGLGGTISNAPIAPERSNFIFRFLLAVAVVAMLLYFFLYHR
jgi:hypothetical protein